LNKVMPFAAFTFVVAGLASMGMPGFSGFVAELKVLIGAWQAFPTLAVFAGLGILVGVTYTLRVIQQAFYAGRLSPEEQPLPAAGAGVRVARAGSVWPDPPPAAPDPRGERFEPDSISLPERAGAVMLMVSTLAVGLYPRLLLNWIVPSLESPLFEGLRKAAGAS
jgi:NADH-quinone oxidoreductase subunit M